MLGSLFRIQQKDLVAAGRNSGTDIGCTDLESWRTEWLDAEAIG